MFGVVFVMFMGIIGGVFYIVMYVFGKIILFMCVGVIYVVYYKMEISDMKGLGCVMFWMFGVFLVGVVSIIGLLLFGGVWSKFVFMVVVVDMGYLIMMGVFMLFLILNVVYLLLIVIKGFFELLLEMSGVFFNDGKLYEVLFLCVIFFVLMVFGCLFLFIYVDLICIFIVLMLE